MIRLLLAEDHTIVRQGLRMVLESERGISVVGEVDDGLKVVDECERARPDVLLLDLGLPGLHGLEVIRQVARRTAAPRVLVLSMHSHDEYVLGAFANGATGYLLKGCDAHELVSAVRRVAGGQRFVGAEVSPHVAAVLRQPRVAAVQATDPYETLTTREREVFHLMAEGHSSAAIAERLYVSPRTIETHRANIMRKLHLRHQTDVVLYAIRRGLLPSV
jgi:DNA-binding NarL/FixJ family response regulator